MNKNTSKRAERILEIAKNMSEGNNRVRNYLEDIQLHYEGYAEPGYHSDEVIATGNWNDVSKYNPLTNKQERISNLPSRILALYEKMGIVCEWSDEWAECSCGKLVRTYGDSYSWTASYQLTDGELTCIDCLKDNPESYLLSLEGNPNVANTIHCIRPEKYGYVKMNKDNAYETGWHPGQNDDPKKIAKELENKNIDRYLFNIDDVGQFDIRWSVYVHKDALNAVGTNCDRADGSCWNCCEYKLFYHFCIFIIRANRRR